MKKKTKIAVSALTSILLVMAWYTKEISAQPSIDKYCADSFFETRQCPENLCKAGCVYIGDNRSKCLPGCIPKSCVEIELVHCPEDSCRVLKGCAGEDVCYYKMKHQPPQCGRVGYNGQDVQCCRGFIRRCGIEFFDGSCDMIGKYSKYAVPMCLPCGNGICDQFENRCNCPEDCSR